MNARSRLILSAGADLVRVPWRRLVCRVKGHVPYKLRNSVWYRQPSQDVGCRRCDVVQFGPRDAALASFRHEPIWLTQSEKDALREVAKVVAAIALVVFIAFQYVAYRERECAADGLVFRRSGWKMVCAPAPVEGQARLEGTIWQGESMRGAGYRYRYQP